MTTIYTKSFVRVVALFAAAMLLLCQTAAAALTYHSPKPQSQVNAVNANNETPCHHASTADSDSTPASGCQDRCPARDASLETTPIHIPSAHALLLTVIAVMPPISLIAAAAPRNDLTATATPPPLRLVYCRLLN